MNKTPETDKIIRNAKIADHPPIRLAATLTVKCEKLERERDEAREAFVIATDQMVVAQCKLRESNKERDEARENLDEEKKFHHRTHAELVQTQCKLLDMQMGRDEIQEKYDNLATEHMLVVNKLCKERDEALEQVKELIYISDRAIELAEIDFENDKFGVVSELRGDLEKIKESK